MQHVRLVCDMPLGNLDVLPPVKAKSLFQILALRLGQRGDQLMSNGMRIQGFRT